ncbi:MAG: zf-HC2 domain-containing protein [Chloroflexi bacterium]|nr:zf-HC2 domain-containing protein [Chloroflexota bacterium]
MSCEELGTLRAYIDGEMSAEDVRRAERHLAGCGRCRDKLDDLRCAANLVAGGLSVLGVLPTLESAAEARAFARVCAGLNTHTSLAQKISVAFGRLKMKMNGFSLRYRLASAGVVALLAVMFIGLTPQGQVAASNFLAQFRAQKLKVVMVDQRELATISSELSHFGDVDVSQLEAMSTARVSSIAEASRRAGFTVRQPQTLPAGIASEPSIDVIDGSTITFTFDVARAQAYLASIGQQSFNIPPKFDGAKLIFNVPTAILLVYGQNNLPLVVGQAATPTADLAGNVTALEMRDLLLRLPGLSQDTVSQLKAMDDWTNTLPIPLPRDQARWREVDLSGVNALVIGDNTGLGSFVIWQQDGIVYGVGGPMAEDQLLTVARSLR